MKSLVQEAQAPLRARYRDDPKAAHKTYRLRSSGRELHNPFTSLVTSLEGCGAGTSFDARGVMRMPCEAEVRFYAIAVHTVVGVAPGTPPELVERMLQTAEKCCIITATLRNPPPIESHVTVRSE